MIGIYITMAINKITLYICEMKLRARTQIISLKSHKWKLQYKRRRRCYFCAKRNRVVYRCSLCRKSVCVKHSTLVCNACCNCTQRNTFEWKINNISRMRCHRCVSKNKVPYCCSICGFSRCHDHASLLCGMCKRDCRLLQKL